ncbi:hypothetical protein GCM10022251_76960 [Phytohabitans flavus]|uniref:Uncharacterized protein n=3 Tax=Phytohabitans flavus TaxID=1076124 RepID=A0A6F8XLQ0_9ACTN|nr:hypothetical protein Pflav_011430 [Phytohabitans flavus]
MGPELPIHRQSIGPPTAHRFNFFAVWLDKGDVVGASVSGAGKRVSGYDPRLREVHGSVVDTSQWLAPASPLPQGGTAGTDHVADEAGWYAVAMQGDGGAYQLTIGVYRPALEGAGRQQTIFLDFDGATLDTSIFPFPGGVEPGPRALSPLRSFLAGWGLTDADESAVIDATIASVEENLLADVVARGGNPRYSLRIVGGTIAESGIPTIGISQYIDAGNMETEDSALVLLDRLSAPAPIAASVNTYLGPGSDRVRFVGRTLATLISHEMGHMFGNFHTEPFNSTVTLSDQGGNRTGLYGVGADGFGGTPDYVDVDFGEDVLVANEGWSGLQDSLSTIAFSVTSAPRS